MTRLSRWALGFWAGLVLIVLLLPLFAAFEAHAINVKAQIESTLEVSSTGMSLDSVFPHETFTTTFTVGLTDAVTQSGAWAVRYQLRSELVPIPATSPTVYYKDLRPFTYQRQDPNEHDGDTETTAALDWHLNDDEDTWVIELFVPCIASKECRGHGTPECPAFPCGGPDHATCQTVPEDPLGSGGAGEYAADIWIQTTSVNYDDPGDMGSCAGCHSPDAMCIQCHRVDNLP